MGSRRYLGLSISPRQLCAVSLNCRRGALRLQAGRVLPLKGGVLSCSAVTPNVLDMPRFAANLKEVLAPFAAGEDRVALSLPDAGGKTLVMELPVGVKTKAEGIDLIRFELKKKLPLKIKDLHLDCQLLERTQEGGSRFLVSLISHAVLTQYEELVAQAGFFPAQVGFHLLDTWSYYRPRLASLPEVGLLSVVGDCLGLQFYRRGSPLFYRATRIDESHFSLSQEISLSLPKALESGVSPKQCLLHLHTDWADPQGALEAVAGVYGGQVELLKPELDRMSPVSLNLPSGETFSLVGAIGAAGRLL